ncbi:uncharacterized protein [Drosophila tropicalis]|uniref:uncharacterized protein isoform X2 n=1 Tax=Drosophila tropicalis TaxID=46794 RepID=UPI0035ABBAA3
MGKKNKIKSSKKKKLEEKAKRSVDMSPTIDLKDIDLANQSEHMANIISLPSRVDKHIESLTALQEQLSNLQLEQIRLLDGCIDFIHELQCVNPQTDAEGKIVSETFTLVKAKIKKVFEDYLPKHLEMLETNLQSLTLK